MATVVIVQKLLSGSTTANPLIFMLPHLQMLANLGNPAPNHNVKTAHGSDIIIMATLCRDTLVWKQNSMV